MGNPNLNTYIDTIQSSINSQNAVISDLDKKNNQLLKKQTVQINQLKEIEDKEKLLLTRSRMLQIAQDRNSYKKKIIYTLIATIFLIFIITIALYIFLIRKKPLNININKK
jgi:hypothetical protein